MCAIVSVTGSGCCRGRGAGWNATRRCATRCSGPMTCSTTTSGRCWTAVRCSPAGSTSPPPRAVCERLRRVRGVGRVGLAGAQVAGHRRAGRAATPATGCWRRSASSPRNELAAPATVNEVRDVMPATSPSRPRHGRSGTAPDSGRRSTGSTAEFANLRAGFRWAADHGDLDAAAAIATYAALPRPSGRKPRADSVGPKARRTRPPPPTTPDSRSCTRLASQVLDSPDGSRPLSSYSEAGRDRSPKGPRVAAVQHRRPAWHCRYSHRPARTGGEWWRARLARGRDTHALTWATWSSHWWSPGPRGGDGRRDGLIDAAEATPNPYALSNALLAYGFAFRNADPIRALDAMHRGLMIAQDSGNRGNESYLADIWPSLRPNRRPAGCARSPHSGDPKFTIRETSPLSVPPWQSSPVFSTGSDAMSQPPPSPVSPSALQRPGVPRDQHRDRPPPRCARRPDLRISRPQGRDDDHRRNGDLRVDQIDQARAELKAISK